MAAPYVLLGMLIVFDVIALCSGYGSWLLLLLAMLLGAVQLWYDWWRGEENG